MSAARCAAWLALACAAATAATAAGAADSGAVEVRAELGPDPVGLAELAQLTLVVDSRGFRAPEIEPDYFLENLVALGSPFRSQSQSWVNGVTSSRVELTWRLRPRETGIASVRRFRAVVGGETHELPDLEIQVVAEPPPRPRSTRPPTPADPFRSLFDEDPFAPFRRRPAPPEATPRVELRATVEPRRVYVGQQAVWRLALETQTDISTFRPRSLPDFAGLWTREIEQPDQPVPEWLEVEGRRTARFTMIERALFPLRPGTTRFDPAEVGVVARVASFGLFGRLGRDATLELESVPTELEVRALPPPPDDFSGLVGRLEIATTLAPSALEVGKAATLVVQLRGDGNFQGAPAPELELPDGLRAFAPTSTIEEQSRRGRLLSELEWSYVVIAERPGRFAVAPVRLRYFDVATEEYRWAESAALVLEALTPAASAARPPAAVATDSSPATPRPRPLLLVAGALAVVALAALAAWLVGVGWRARHRHGSPGHRLRTRLAAARSEVTPRAAAQALDEAWREHLESRYALPARSPIADAGPLLTAAGVDRATVADVLQLFEELHLLEFAPELADAEALRDDLFERSRRLVRRLA